MISNSYKVGVIGGGAVGLTYVALLSKVTQVRLLVRREKQAEVINKLGVSFQDRNGEEEFVGKVKTSVDFSVLRDCDAVIVAVKSYDTYALAEELSKNIPENTAVLTLQNGIEALDVLKTKLKNPDRVFAGVTYVGASRKDDRTVVNGTSFITIVDEGVGKLVDFMKSTNRLEVDTTSKAKRVVWNKLALNVAQNPLSATTNLNFGEMLASDDCLGRAESLLKEFVLVAEAEGLDYNLEDLMQKLKENWTGSVFYPSMWQDIHNKRATEIEALNGAISKLGDKHGIPTPENDKITQEIKQLEKFEPF